MAKIELVVFDCDGVIADSEAISANVLLELLADHGPVLTTDDVWRSILGRSFATVAQIIRDDHALPLPGVFEVESRQRSLARYASEQRPTAGCLELIHDLA